MTHLLRTALYVPATNAKALSRADQLGADAVIIDLEDSVAPEAKAAARAALTSLPRPSATPRVIRINAAETEWHEADIAAAAAILPHAMLLPKVGSEEDVWAFRRLIALQRPAEPVAAWAMIETPAGVLNAARIAAALGPDGALVLGLNDLAKETGMQAGGTRQPFHAAMGMVVLAARAHRVACLDGVFNALADTDGFDAECRQGKSFGFDGKTVIHPSQIAIANAVFGPSPEDIAAAEAIIAAFALPENRERGVIALNGQMVERLHLEQAVALVGKARRASGEKG